MSGLECDVCGEIAIGVSSGACGPVSFAYCRSCLDSGAEPFGSLAAYLGCGGVERSNVHADYIATIEATCRVADKTVEDFWAEVKRIGDETTAEMTAFYESEAAK